MLCTILFVIGITIAAASSNNAGFAVLTLIGCFIVDLLLKLVDVLVRIKALLQKD